MRWKVDGAMKTQSFATEEEREEAAKAISEKAKKYGTEVLTFDPKEWRRWLEAKEQLAGADIFDVIREWRTLRGNSGLSTDSVSVADAITKYVDFRRKETLSPDTWRHITKHVEQRFGGFFAGQKLRDVTPEKIEEWLESLISSKGALKGQPVDPLTRRHHRKDVNTFLDYCVRRQWLVNNPCELVPVPAVEEEDVVLLTLEEGQRLFAENQDEPVIGRIALEAFGFLRASSAGRLQKEHVNFAEKGIRMPGPQHKSRKAMFRQGHPDNLWAWLNRAPAETWAMNWWEYRNEKSKAFARAKIDGGSENRLRKTCLSAHLAWQKNQPLTSYLAQHRHTSTTDIYLGVMTETDGKKWFEILPQ